MQVLSSRNSSPAQRRSPSAIENVLQKNRGRNRGLKYILIFVVSTEVYVELSFLENPWSERELVDRRLLFYLCLARHLGARKSWINSFSCQLGGDAVWILIHRRCELRIAAMLAYEEYVLWLNFSPSNKS